MRRCPDLPALLAYHRANVAGYGGRPLVLDLDGYLRTFRDLCAGRFKHGVTVGHYRLVDGRYRHGARAILLSIRYAFDVVAALATERVVSGAEASRRMPQTTSAAVLPADRPDSIRPWERVVRPSNSATDAVLSIGVMLGVVLLLGQMFAALFP